MLNECRKRIGNENIMLADAFYLPFRDNAFDVVFSSFFLDLLPESSILPAINEMARVMKDGGRLIAVSMSKYGHALKKFARMLYEVAYLKWPMVKGYRPSSRPIRLKDELIKAGMKIKRWKLTTIPLFHFPVEIVVATY